ncbi:MAG: hypothetical protein HOD63_04160 [Bacteroidetes bacterium]|jgi:hypothetical protein|nr:hypothetical protein [Bacteroidota bacterium]MBT5529210.1 hypothetical protein [Cytophagia bacterium]MBT3932720.1 hypothetical protein [Bacteroidota bacterium]MBT4337758.1 hypothetical protein [Bacteroidota bacterium]MBT4729949.1 hypothetical protein [Bacteroidota bacterium]
MNTEVVYIVAIVVIVYLILQPIRTKYGLEKLKPLIIIPVVIAPLFNKVNFQDISSVVKVLSVLLIGFAIWKTINNFKKK